MNPNRFFIPNLNFYDNYYNPQMLRINSINPNGMGLFNGIMSKFRFFNLNNFLNSANKTLNLMNQTIPIIKQAKPMVNNIKSMFKLVRTFNSETTNNKIINSNKEKEEIKKEKQDSFNNNYPTFFI